ncbi:MAG: peptide-methionine (R)-S-oxide reductase MsrB [Nitrospirae bacterium]|nr:peptide-methionine (R)-S-oxide reductase MsrB [Nitrospirota bacterium]
MDRRTFLSALGLGALALPRLARTQVPGGMVEKIHRGDAEWQRLLTREQYVVLRKQGTEKPGSSPLLHEKRPGTYHCAGCDLALFDSAAKYDSGTGWPSFFDAIPGHVETELDFSLFLPRTEYHCARCGGHQGHIFDDGPPPTGRRYCNNGVALTFAPRA